MLSDTRVPSAIHSGGKSAATPAEIRPARAPAIRRAVSPMTTIVAMPSRQLASRNWFGVSSPTRAKIER